MSNITVHRIGIIMNGVTGRMGTNQHLLRSIVPIIQEGGLRVSDSEVILPEPILVGRNPAKLERLAGRTGISRWTTDLDTALADPAYTVYFDAQTTGRRPEAVAKAVAAGKHVYCEKPTALTADEAYRLYCLARDAGVKHGVVQDKLWLPGFRKLNTLLDSGFFGKLLAVRAEFGYWVFEGDAVPAQRPSWNYRAEDGGGIVLDMFAHWRYLLDHLFGQVRAVSCHTATLIPRRWDENGKPYSCTADDAAWATFELEGGVIAQFNSSWAVRVYRDDLLEVQVDGTRGSAVAGLRDCRMQAYAAAPRAVWNPDIEDPNDYRGQWSRVPDYEPYGNAFRAQWECFLRHVALDEPFPWNLREGAKGVQLAEIALASRRERRWLEVPELPA